MVDGADYISGNPSADTSALGRLAKSRAGIAARARNDQYETERIAKQRARRERILGQKEKIEVLNEKISVLEEQLAETTDETKKKPLELQINKLKLKKARLEKRVANRLTKDRKSGELAHYAIEATHANLRNHVRSFGLGQGAATSEKDFIDRLMSQRDQLAKWQAKVALGKDPGSDLESTSFVSQSFASGES